jgi:DDE superfamily endonuclease
VVKPLVAGLSTKIVLLSQGLRVLFYRAALPLSRQTLTFVSGLIRTYRREIGSPWRLLNTAEQALLVLVHLRKGEPFAEVGAGFGVSTTTCWRYVTETVELLAARAPKLRAALREAKRAGHAYLVIDGTLIPIDRVAADRPFYSGKHHKHGVNVQVIASPDGTILWVSGDLPGATHDTAAARIWNILAALRDTGLIALGDKGYHGYDPTGQHVITPYKGKNKPTSQTDPASCGSRLVASGGRGRCCQAGGR